MQKPSIGRIVIYRIPAHGVVHPAIITEVLGPPDDPTMTVNLTVFGIGGMPAQYVLTVAHESELQPPEAQPCGHLVNSPNTRRWEWPPRV